MSFIHRNPSTTQRLPGFWLNYSGNRQFLHSNGTALRALVLKASGLQPYELAGPDWLVQSRFDIQVTYPPGASEQQFPEMLRVPCAVCFRPGLRLRSKGRRSMNHPASPRSKPSRVSD